MRSIRVICVLIFVRIGELSLVSPALKTDLVDRESERRGPVSLVFLVYRVTGLRAPPFFHPYGIAGYRTE